jgi:hypothetical protein
MQTKHTPGPWAWDRQTAVTMLLKSFAPVDSCPLHDPVVFALRSDWASWAPWPDSANARLIVAAPDLLAACVTALSVLDVCKCQNGHELLAASAVRAAIAKATS